MVESELKATKLKVKDFGLILLVAIGECNLRKLTIIGKT